MLVHFETFQHFCQSDTADLAKIVDRVLTLFHDERIISVEIRDCCQKKLKMLNGQTHLRQRFGIVSEKHWFATGDGAG
jgi:hypothetical protein